MVDGLARVLARTCRRLAEAGLPQDAGRLAADGWALLRRTHADQAQRLDGTMHYIARVEHELEAARETEREESPVTDRIVDVRTEDARVRHELIFDTFGTLAADTAFVLVNDHDPKPLYYQLAAENPGAFSWDYLEEGPEVWRVRIGKVARGG